MPAPLSRCPRWTGGRHGVVSPEPEGGSDEDSDGCRGTGGGVSVYAALPAIAEEKAAEKPGGVLGARVQDLNLTDDQKAKIADIRKEYRPKVQEAGNKLRATVKEEVEAILAVIKE